MSATGETWTKNKLAEEMVEKARFENGIFLAKKLGTEKYSEIFLSMGKEYAGALPLPSDYGGKVVFPTTGGPGPKARALKQWLQSISKKCAKGKT